jgi:hypothetical protein
MKSELSEQESAVFDRADACEKAVKEYSDFQQKCESASGDPGKVSGDPSRASQPNPTAAAVDRGEPAAAPAPRVEGSGTIEPQCPAGGAAAATQQTVVNDSEEMRALRRLQFCLDFADFQSFITKVSPRLRVA